MTVFFKKLIYKYLRLIWNSWYPQLPLVELESKHVANCTVLTNRIELLKVLPKNGEIAEIGVERGMFSNMILSECNPKIFHLVDTWTNKKIEEECKEAIDSENVKYHKMHSIAFLESAKRNSLDWIYIDTDHTYKTTKKELELASNAVKDTGFICGHDYTSVAYSGLRKYGVVEAVNEFCVKNNYEIIFITSETTRHVSYALRKMVIL